MASSAQTSASRSTTASTVIEGMSFDRGYISHHMVTDVEKMEAVLDNPYILLTDLKIKEPSQLENLRSVKSTLQRTAPC